MSETGYAAIDLFCGAGGLSAGLDRAGFDIVWAADNDKKSIKTYRHNHPDTSVSNSDISEIEFPEIDTDISLDLVAGGPPCPTFSVIGRAKLNSLESRETTTDERHQLWEEFLRAVDHYTPRAFVMENVKGMASAENDAGRPVLPIILDAMQNLGYRVDATVLDAANYGIPQRRERLFIVGNRNDRPNPDLESWATHREPVSDRERKARLLSGERTDEGQQTLDAYTETGTAGRGLVERSPNYRRPWVTVGEAILDLPPLSPAGDGSYGPDTSHPPNDVTQYQIPAFTEYQEWARNIPSDSNWENCSLTHHSARFHNMADLSIYKMLCEATGWRIAALDDEFQPYRTDVFVDNYTRQAPTQPASTIDAHIHKDGHRHIHPTEARSLTVREAARLQSFRDTYEFPVNRTAAYQQVGNAVPPLLAETIGEAIIDTILL